MKKQKVREIDPQIFIKYIGIKTVLSLSSLKNKKGVIYTPSYGTIINEIKESLKENEFSYRLFNDTNLGDTQDADILIITNINALNNLSSPFDYIVFHCSNEKILKQFLESYNYIFNNIYIHTNRDEEENIYYDVPDKYLNTPLSAEQRKNLGKYLGIKTNNGERAKWPTLKKKLLECKYELKESRVDGKRCVTIKKIKPAQ